ncbi:MAG: proline--tRNA ligase [Acidimicrobiales bacterium]|jgi:prolyl-tRNA synthetase
MTTTPQKDLGHDQTAKRDPTRSSVLTPQSDDFPRWYQQVVAKAELADNGPVRGTMVIRPYGYAIWERMQAELDSRIKAAGASNAYFPLFIPESYLRREAEHVEGFSPELAVVTYGGGKQLEEPVVVRPTSETIINSYLSKWIQSHRDLPLLVNQWANVVRWEMRPRLFLRTTEFLWQEGHTAHASEAEARAYALKILREVYIDFMVNVLGIPVLAGYKTERERFAGATTTWTCEAMMRDGKALQMATSHELGQNFSRAFDISFIDDTGAQAYVWQSSWGTSTRLMGALVMAHGDDAGLRLPPKISPIQVVVLAVKDDPSTLEQTTSITAALRAGGIRAESDQRVDTSFGRRAVSWELKGVPVRIEVGPRDLERGEAVLCRRDTGTKVPIALAGVVTAVSESLEAAQSTLLTEATERYTASTQRVSSLAEAIEAAQTGFALVPAGLITSDGEARLNEEGVSVRCFQQAGGGLPVGNTLVEDLEAVVARAY